MCLQSNVAASNAKLALFYDWLFFNPDKDSIMNIGHTHTQTHTHTHTHQQYTHWFTLVHTAGPDVSVCVCFSEPAILVMHHSMKPHPAITATLLDFMCRVTHTHCNSLCWLPVGWRCLKC